MNPLKEKVETVIREYKRDIIAMNILDEGAFSPEQSYLYLESFDNLKHSVISALSNEHLKDLIEVFKE